MKEQITKRSRAKIYNKIQNTLYRLVYMIMRTCFLINLYWLRD